ncbi:hypothetical protein SteCoe_14038 [Stentor coeruleus]|uniref:Uncharacterized protein n=1 Tax=Stentor coeruleus TaxID=5963 RepID=A0A1R2C6Y8_9CILI|nr:hypothetical protein SteCoe_14038 [Stentor coeruleus]
MSTNGLDASQGIADLKYKIQVIDIEPDNIMKLEILPKSATDDSLAAEFNLSADITREKLNKKICFDELFSQTKESSSADSLFDTGYKKKSRNFNISPTIKMHFALKANHRQSNEDDLISIRPLRITKKVQFNKSNLPTKNRKGLNESTCICLVF